ncbi:hypothetical protein HDV02_003133 [Globomyces sp. JEL0801]|nr:hypothetical protein HDV02_003133 [Globomyces sp. JEL0801]
MLECHVKSCKNGFPLPLSNVEMEEIEADFNPDFITRLLPKLDWNALLTTCNSLDIQLPSTVPEDLNNDFLKSLHKIILEYRIKEGLMICNGCGHEYQIKNCIPNMLLNDDEV